MPSSCRRGSPPPTYMQYVGNNWAAPISVRPHLPARQASHPQWQLRAQGSPGHRPSSANHSHVSPQLVSAKQARAVFDVASNLVSDA